MDFLRTAPFGSLFTAAFVLGAAFHSLLVLIQIVVAFAAPGMFTLNGNVAASSGEALGAVAVMFIALIFLNAGVAALGSLCWLAVRRWLPTKAATHVEA